MMLGRDTKMSLALSRARSWLAEQLVRYWRSLDGWIDAWFVGKLDAKDASAVHEYRPDATAIEEAPIPVSARASLYVVLILIALAIVWAIFGTVDRIVVAPGKVATRSPLVVMQVFATSRIQSIFVKAGDHVVKGQTLVSFDPAFAQADENALAGKVRALTAEIDRIGAELSGAVTFDGAKNVPEQRIQAQIFSQQMGEFAAEMAVRDSRARSIASQIEADNRSALDLRRELAMAQKVVGIRKFLLAQNAGALLDVMMAEKDEIDFELRLQSVLADTQKLQEQNAEINAERQSFLDKWRGDLTQRLVAARQEQSDALETLNKAHRMKDFTRLVAPVGGVVLEMADRSVGSVLREAETLVTLVPDNAALYVEATILSRDVGYVAVGDLVSIKLEAYPFQRYGTLEGRLEVISPDSVPLKEGDESRLVYRAQVRLKTTSANLLQRGILLRPGLVASAEIKTGKRSIASYILDPIFGTVDESLREP